MFTAGIGEHSAPVRMAICERLRWLGVAIDEPSNAAHAEIIGRPDSKVEIRVVATDEESIIARHTRMQRNA